MTATATALASLKVLIIDDDRFMLAFEEQLVRTFGVVDVHVVADGRLARQMVDDPDTCPDAIVCDLDMPEMDGIEFIHYLSDRRFAGGVIVASGAGDRIVASVAALVRSLDLHLVASLTKPVDPDTLHEALSLIQSRAARIPGDGLAATRFATLDGDDIRAGIAAGYADICVQPQVSLADRHVTGVEVLLRWTDPERGILSPTAVVPVAEDAGLIDDLTLAIYRRATECLSACRAAGFDLRVAVNLSTLNLHRLDLPERLSKIAQESGVPTGQIVLEITESRLIEDVAASLEVLGRLRLHGFGLSVDDFGTGYSSLELLRQLPFNELKVDQTFVRGARSDSGARTIIESAVALGRNLGMRVVVEGVETDADWALVEQFRCDAVQGYYVAHPMPACELHEWLSAWNAIGAEGF